MLASNLMKLDNSSKSFLHFFLMTLIGKRGKVSQIEIMFKILSEIQTFGMLLYFPFQVIDKKATDAFGSFARTIAQHLCFNDLFDFRVSSWINNVLWIFITIYVLGLVIMAALLTFYYFSKKRISLSILKTWNSLGITHYSFVFLLIHQQTLSILKYTDAEGLYLFTQDKNLMFVILAGLFIPLNIFFAFLFCKFSYNPFRSGDFTAKRTSSPDLLILLFKTIDVPLSLYVESIIQKWLRVIVMVIIFALNLKVYASDVPYYHYKSQRMFTRFSFILFSLTLSNTIMIVLAELRGIQTFSSIYLSITLSIFFIKLSDLLNERMINNSFPQIKNRTRNKKDFLKKLYALDHILNRIKNRIDPDPKKKTLYEYLFYGILTNHKALCNKTICGCQVFCQNANSRNDFSIKIQKELEKSLKFDLIKELYEESIKEIPSDFEIKISLIYLLHQTNSYSDGPLISLVHALDLSHRNIEMRVIASTLLEYIKDNMESTKNDQSINIKDVIDYQILTYRLKKSIKLIIDKYLDFWETYKAPDPLIQKLYSVSVIINRDAAEIDRTWGNIIVNYTKLSYQDHLIYGLFQSLVRSAPYSAQKTLQTYIAFANLYDPDKNREPKITPDNISESINIILYLSMKKEKLGTINFVTPNVEDIFQYHQKEIVEKNISTIMPPFYRERHTKYLVTHIKRGQASLLNKNVSVFGRKKDGNVIPLTVYVSIFPYFQEQLVYVGILRAINIYDQCILVLDDGTVDGFTEEIGKKLNLNPKLTRRYHLREISRELAQLHKKFLSFMKEEIIKSKSLSMSSKNFSQSEIDGNIQAILAHRRSFYSQKEEYIGSLKKEPSNASITNFSTDETAKLYEIFTTTGSTIYFNRLNDINEGYSSRNPSKLGFNIVIVEQMIQSSHLRIYKLQSLNNELNETQINEMQSKPSKDPELNENLLGSQRNKQALVNQENSLNEESVPMDTTLKIDIEAEKYFRNPFSDMPDCMSNKDSLASPKDLYSPKDPLLPKADFKLQEERVTETNTILPTRGATYQNFENDYQVNFRRNENNLTPKSPSRPQIVKTEMEPVEKSKSSNNEIQNTPKIENIDLKQFLKDHKIIYGNEEIDRNSVASSVKMNKLNSRFENAIYLNYDNSSTKILTFLMVTFCLANIGMLIYTLETSNKNLDRVKNNIDILKLSYERIFNVVDANKIARTIKFLQAGLAANQRHTFDESLSSQNQFLETAQAISYYNSKMRNSIYKIDSSQYQSFYTQINVKIKEDINKTRLMNTFDLCTEIANSALELYALLPTKPLSNDTNINFILNNTFGDFLLQNQYIVTILRVDNGISVNSIQNTVIAVLSIAAGISLILFLAVLKSEISFIKQKAHFIEIFLMIKDQEIEPHLALVNNFKASLKDGRNEERLMERMAEEKAAFKTKVFEPKSKSFKAKKANYKGMNNSIAINLLFTLFFLLIFVIIFCSIFGLFSASQEPIEKSRLRVIDAKGSYLRFGLLLTLLYEYISESGMITTIDQSRSQGWESLYSSLTLTNYYLSTFIEQDKAYNVEVEQELIGDLCPQLFSNRDCYSEISGIASKGILALDNYMLKFLREVKDYFDSSDRTDKAKAEALSRKALIDAETLFGVYSKTSYQKLDASLTVQFSKEVDSFIEHLLMLVIFSVIIFCLATNMIWVRISKRMQEERSNYRKIMRLVPISVIMNNRYLKHHLFTHSKKILEPVKNQI